MALRDAFSFSNHTDREIMEELCCLSIRGDLTRDESIMLEKHLKRCKECRILIKDFERVMLRDLPAAAVARATNPGTDSIEAPSEDQLFARFNVRRQSLSEIPQVLNAQPAVLRTAQACKATVWKRIRRWAASSGPLFASTAAGVLITFVVMHRNISGSTAPPMQSVAPQIGAQPKVNEWEDRAVAAEGRANDLNQKLGTAEQHLREASMVSAQLSGANQKLSNDMDQLQSQLTQAQAELKEEGAKLDIIRASFRDEAESKAALEAQLQEINSRREKERAELAHFEQIAATTPARVPVAERDIENGEAKEILGARDLHIVDVYDIGGGGKAAKTYGRIYLVNHSLLVFYAFDLPPLGKSDRAVAFQAWGFRQPDSKTPESLGLFYLDNAKLNRWTLRVSDPQVLSHIDTLFVTAEPAGGSRSPRGKQLLMASLAGPANHP